jgi:3-phenylpropionate/trans-cinnamate dioxygenase ferredoxin subunit
MSEFIRVGTLFDFQSGAIHSLSVGQRNLALIRLGEQFFAVENFCTHEAVTFTSGYGVVAASSLICMLHGSAFDLATGDVINGPAGDNLATFEVRVNGDDVFVAQEPTAPR